ncbi:DUF4374 domain-containing protein [Pedobacter nototheniae]|uniref:DUF4374 domain-containing protein n=1 Tax=Pedobacter nototheniae TaxID=2488994 RepID=UPI0029303A1B|nr:DUF4374 domain-containing protein [Pedobacter nototheniae]
MTFKKNTFYIFRLALFALGFALLFGTLQSCVNSNDSDLKPAKYSFYILGKEGKEYVIQTNSLTIGEIKPEVVGAALDGNDMDRDVFVKNGQYYHLNRKTSLFSKFKVEHGEFKKITDLKIEDFSIENFTWLNGDTLLLTGLNEKLYNQPKFVLIKTGDMKIIDQGLVDIPRPSGKYTSMSIGLVEKRNQKIFVGYTYHMVVGTSNYVTSDTLYVSTLSYPEMKLLKTERDTRSTYPGGINTVQSYTFDDGRGDYYFMSCPGIALGNRPEIPTGIFRIKAGATGIDPAYFFNISASAIKNHAYGMWYLVGDEAIIRSERKDLFKGLGDHYSTAHFEFYVINLKTKAIKKLNLPLDKGTRRECVIVENGIANIAVNSTKEGNYIWQYNIKTGALTKGLQFGGDTDFILRMDKL